MDFCHKNTKRLVIRPLIQSDYEHWKKSHIIQLEPQNIWDKGKLDAELLNRTEFKKLLKSQKNLRDKDEFYDLAVFKKRTGELIGTVAAMNIVRSVTQSAFLGYFIKNNYWNQGFGKEAVLGMVDIAFKQLKLHRLEAGVEPDNRRSIRLIRSVGFRKEGLKKRVVYLREGWRDLSIYSATCEEFGVKWKGEVQSRRKS